MRSKGRKADKYNGSFTVVHMSSSGGWRGGEQQLAYLMEELEEKSVQQLLICPDGSKLSAFCVGKNLTHYCFKPGNLSRLLMARSIFRVSKSVGFPMFHAHDSHSHTSAYLAELFFGVKSPLVVSRRVDFPIAGHFFSKRKYNSKQIAAIICVSDAIKRIIEPEIKNKELLTTIHSGIDPEKFKNKVPTQALHELLKLDTSVRLIGNTSAISDHKGYFTFVDTCELLVRENQKVHFLVIGDGPLRREVETYVHSKGLNPHVSFMGFREDIPSILPQLSVFLFPSITEGLGTSVLDAFASGVPVVASNTGGIPEMVVQAYSGFLCEVRDSKCMAASIVKILEDAVLAKTLTENALLVLKDFNRESTALKTLEVYNKVAEKYFEKSI